MTILHSYMGSDPMYGMALLCCGIAIFLVVATVLIIQQEKGVAMETILLILGAIATFVMSFGLAKGDTFFLQQRYYATIDNSVSLEEIFKNYNIIEQKGSLFILEEKEV